MQLQKHKTREESMFLCKCNSGQKLLKSWARASWHLHALTRALPLRNSQWMKGLAVLIWWWTQSFRNPFRTIKIVCLRWTRFAKTVSTTTPKENQWLQLFKTVLSISHVIWGSLCLPNKDLHSGQTSDHNWLHRNLKLKKKTWLLRDRMWIWKKKFMKQQAIL